jgi:hypothetical protein
MIPTLIVDNFFKDPKKILDLSNKCSFLKDTEGRWPGKRTNLLHEVNNNFFQLFHKKIFSLLYPNFYEKLTWSAGTYFHKINGKEHDHEGWVHNDSSEFTAIVYLSDHEDCGTSLWEPKDFHRNLNEDKKNLMYQNKISNFEGMAYLKENNNQFKKILTVQSKFNRLLVFDSKAYHSAEKFTDPNCEQDRLTLITFVFDFRSPEINLKYPILECMRTQ